VGGVCLPPLLLLVDRFEAVDRNMPVRRVAQVPGQEAGLIRLKKRRTSRNKPHFLDERLTLASQPRASRRRPGDERFFIRGLI
jgi:hypothetical protein